MTNGVYLIEHTFRPEITKDGRLTFVRDKVYPETGVVVTSRNNVAYVVGKNGNLIKE